MIRVTHFGVVAAKPRVSHLAVLFSFTLYGADNLCCLYDIEAVLSRCREFL